MNCNNIIKSTYRSHFLLLFFGYMHLLLSSAETKETVVSKSTCCSSKGDVLMHWTSLCVYQNHARQIWKYLGHLELSWSNLTLALHADCWWVTQSPWDKEKLCEQGFKKKKLQASVWQYDSTDIHPCSRRKNGAQCFCRKDVMQITV